MYGINIYAMAVVGAVAEARHWRRSVDGVLRLPLADPVHGQRVAPGQSFSLTLSICGHSPVTVVERGVQYMRAQQILDELAHASLADGAVQAVIDDFVQGDGHSSAHTALQHTAFFGDTNPTETPPPPGFG